MASPVRLLRDLEEVLPLFSLAAKLHASQESLDDTNHSEFYTEVTSGFTLLTRCLLSLKEKFGERHFTPLEGKCCRALQDMMAALDGFVHQDKPTSPRVNVISAVS